MIKFDRRLAVSQLECDQADMMDNSVPILASGLRIGDLESMDIYGESSSSDISPDIPFTSKEVQDAVMEYLSENTGVVRKLARGINEQVLSSISGPVCFDVVHAARESVNFNIFLGAISKGYLVSDNFINEISATLKIAYVPEKKVQSVHFKRTAQTRIYRAQPAIEYFNAETIKEVSAYVGQGMPNLYEFLSTECRTDLGDGHVAERSILDADDMTLAKALSNSQGGIKRLKDAGCDSTRLKNLSILAKALRDSNV